LKNEKIVNGEKENVRSRDDFITTAVGMVHLIFCFVVAAGKSNLDPVSTLENGRRQFCLPAAEAATSFPCLPSLAVNIRTKNVNFFTPN